MSNSPASRYDATEEWCNNIVKNGGNVLFDIESFDYEINNASEELGFPVEVREHVL